ncbi:hypothetical protein VNO78_19648 [Psophocarpus tetragonolobus]|uniref:Pectinesterase inhibitor domain-containing protein n=1 Tax=Psophocarpus tetragonolobus TaxID=3891 RepID=A0AAN9XGF9_PSOTE
MNCSGVMLTLCLILICDCPLAANAKAEGDGAVTVDSHAYKLINEICRETVKEEANCLKILKADAKVVRAKHTFEFVKAVLELAIRKGKEGQNFLRGLLKKGKSPAIASCANRLYGGMIGSFWSAIGELKEDPLTASYDARVAGDGPAYCESAIGEEHIVNPAISALNHRSSLLCQIAFLATNKLPM